MDLKFLLYFIIGGLAVSIVTYLGSHGKGILAAFVALFPAVTIITFYLIYLNSGVETTLSYAKGLLILTPAWLLYVGVIIVMLPRYGFGASILSGVLLYITASLLTYELVKYLKI